jgi:hypothetical protein
VCETCRRKVPPWVWNRFTAGLDQDPGAHLNQAFTWQRQAWLRAGFGEVSPTALATVLWLGCLGLGWLSVELRELWLQEHAAAARFGFGFRWSLAFGGSLAAFAGTLHALQPGGPGPAATARQTFQIVGTAYVSPAVAWLALGSFGFVGSAALGSGWILGGCAVGALLAGLAGLVATGRGFAIRRGTGTFLSIAWTMMAALVAATLLGVGTWLALDQPWGDPWG